MAQNNSSNQVFTNNADGFKLGGGTTERDLTLTGGNATLTGAGTNIYNFPPVNGGVIMDLNRVTVADTAYSVLVSDSLVSYTTLTATRAVTLLAAATFGTNRILIIKDEAGTAGANNITITGTVDGVTNKSITSNYGKIVLYCTGSAYFTLT